ncbi:MAG: DUF2141 domain-containing protein [Nostocaceae cyanobacterium]|nr:DUF2141 domain-containing protein [Nostocaceae cyanobacterium]
MQKQFRFSTLILATLATCTLAQIAYAEPRTILTVIVDGIRHQKGEICLRVYDSEVGFPLNNTSEVKSACTQITGTSIKKQFSGLKPGTYAVAVVDDQNGDRKLNRDFFGIPKEGFGLSRNPKVSITTGTPKFRDTSFALNKNKTIKIMMKYQLDS